MKKKIIIPIISIIIIIIIGISIFLFINRKVYSTITIDINPSIKLTLNKKNKVIKVIPINEDGKEIITRDVKGKGYEQALTIIAKNVIKKGYYKDKQIQLLIYATGQITGKQVENSIIKPFDEEAIHHEVIIIDKISKEDKEVAKKYKISEAKAHYINEIKKEYKDIPIESLIDSSISSLNDTSSRGKYCEKGYFLEGDFCLKELKRVDATPGKVCKENSFEFDGICYEEVGAKVTEEYECSEGWTLENDNMCHNTVSMDAIGICSKGEYRPDIKKCEIKEYVGEPVEICRITPETDILMDHKCYGPKPTINGGCLGNDVIINGGCVDLNSYYESDWKCPNGEFLNYSFEQKCYERQFVEPTSMSCEDKTFKQEGYSCVKYETTHPYHKAICPEGTTEKNGRCIYLNKTTPKINGYTCPMDNSRLDGKTCIIYDIKPAKE